VNVAHSGDTGTGGPGVNQPSGEASSPEAALRAELRQLAMRGEAAFLFAADASLIWCTPSAATLLGAKAPADLTVGPPDGERLPIARIAELATAAAPLAGARLERLRVLVGRRSDVLTLACRRIVMADKRSVLLAVAMGRKPTLIGAMAATTPDLPDFLAVATVAPVPDGEPVSAGVPATIHTVRERAGRPALRVLWRSDAEARFVGMSPELDELLGPGAGPAMGETMAEAGARGLVDLEGRFRAALSGRETFTGVTLLCPLLGHDGYLPVVMSGVPSFDGDRRFEGFRGFGVCRLETLVDASGSAVDEAPPVVPPATPHPPEQGSLPTDSASLGAPGEGPATPRGGDVLPFGPLHGSAQGQLARTNVVQLKQAQRPGVAKITAPGLSRTERHAFREIARALGARVEGDEESAAPVAGDPLAALLSGQGARNPDAEPQQPSGPDEPLQAPTGNSAPEAPAEEDVAGPGAEPAVPEEVEPAAVAAPVAAAPAVDDRPEVRVPDEPSAPEAEAEDGLEPSVAPDAQPEPAGRAGLDETGLVETGLVETGLGETGPAETGLGETEPPEPDPAEDGLVAGEHSRTEASDGGPGEPALPEAMPASAERPEPEPAQAEPVEPEAAEPEAAELSSAEADPSLAEPRPAAPQPAAPDDLAANAAAMFDRLPIGILVSRGDVPIVMNRTLLDLTGYEDIDAFHADGGLAHLFRNAGDPDAAPEGSTLTITTRDGETLAVDARLQRVNWSGLPATLVSFRRAVDPESDRKLRALDATLARRDREARELRAIMDTATDGVIVVDEEGRILSINRSGEALFGYDQAELLGQTFIALFAPDSHATALDYLEGLRANGVASVLNDGREVVGRVRQGGRIPLFMTLGAVSEGPERKFCAVLRDITPWKKAELDLTEAKRAAEEASAQKSDFLAKISHEIRTPLSAIIGFAEVMIEERFGPIGNERYLEYLRDIHASGGHVISLVNDLLDLSKIEAGRFDLTFVSVDVNEIVARAVALMQPQAGTSRVVVRTALANRLPRVVADERSLRQIVLNLLSNGIKFTDPGGQVIVSTALTDQGEVAVRIRDTGIGMTEKEIETALEPFRQIATARRAGGTGLGLPLTKALVEANRAALTIRSARDAGTLVEVVFPTTRVLAE
jgi:PAS domain S-box-containing protein